MTVIYFGCCGEINKEESKHGGQILVFGSNVLKFGLAAKMRDIRSLVYLRGMCVKKELPQLFEINKGKYQNVDINNLRCLHSSSQKFKIFSFKLCISGLVDYKRL